MAFEVGAAHGSLRPLKALLFVPVLALLLLLGCDQTTSTAGDSRRQSFSGEENAIKPSVEKNSQDANGLEIDDGTGAPGPDDDEDDESEEDDEGALDLPESQLDWDGKTIRGATTFQMIPID